MLVILVSHMLYDSKEYIQLIKNSFILKKSYSQLLYVLK